MIDGEEEEPTTLVVAAPTRGGAGYLLAAAAGLGLCAALAFPLTGGVIARRLLDRADPGRCATALRGQAARLCGHLAKTPDDRARCEAAVLTLPAPEMCEYRVNEIARCGGAP